MQTHATKHTQALRTAEAIALRNLTRARSSGASAAEIARAQMYTCRAPFFVGGRWRVVKWTAAGDGNCHAFVASKARELGATGWDVGQADFAEADRYPHASR